MTEEPGCPLCGGPLALRSRVAFDGISVSARYECPDCWAVVQAEAPLP